MRHIVDALSRHHTVDVLVMRRGDQAYVERNGTARILRVPPAEGGMRAQVEAFRRALRRQLEGSDYDIVHFRDGWSGIPVLELRPRLEYAAVFDAARSPLGETLPIDLEFSAELARDQQACLVGADLVLAPTESARSAATRSHPERVHVVAPGVDVNAFDWDDATPGPPVVLFSGTLSPGRGVRVLLRAMAQVVRQVDARLVIAGALDRDFRRSLKGAIRELDLQGRVDLMGEVDHADMPELIGRATVCVAPSAPESRTQPMALFPTKLLEYMACRRAVVAPRRGTTAMLLRSGTHGLVFEPGDPQDLARNILILLKDHDMRARVAEAGYQLVRQSHTVSGTRRALRKAYQDLLERMPGRQARFATVSSGPAPETSPSHDLEMALGAGGEAADTTDPYVTPVAARDSAAGATAALAADLAAGDITAVEQRSKVAESPSPSPWAGDAEAGEATVLATIPPAPPGDELDAQLETGQLDTGQLEVVRVDTGEIDTGKAEGDDDWVVSQWGDKSGTNWRSLASMEESTPVDAAAVPPASLLENHFVAGEVEVRELRPEEAEQGDEAGAFQAVSVLLGSLDDDTGDAGTDEPG